MKVLSFIGKKNIKYNKINNKSKQGILFLCKIKKKTNYYIKIIGKNNGNSPVLLYIGDENNKRIHYSNNTKLLNINSELKIQFLSGNYDKLYIGLLFLNPSKNDSFDIENFSVIEMQNTNDKIPIILNLNNNIIDNNIVDNNIVDNNIVDNNIVDNNIVDNNIVDNNIVEQKNELKKILKSKYFNTLGIKIVNISESLCFFNQIYDIFSLVKYDKNKHINEPVLFFGLYEETEYNLLIKHEGDKYILWGGTDVDMQYINKIKNMNIIHFSSSLNVYNRLINKGIESKYFLLWFSNPNIFKITVPKKLNKVYIYNGSCSGNNWKYGKNLYLDVIKKLKNYEDIEFVLTDKIFPYPYEKMFEIYKDCFIALRLTPKDACAATVQELSLMGIPCVHNCNNYPNVINYNSVDDIVKIIKECYKNRYNYDKKLIRNKTLKLIENNGYTF